MVSLEDNNRVWFVIGGDDDYGTETAPPWLRGIEARKGNTVNADTGIYEWEYRCLYCKASISPLPEVTRSWADQATWRVFPRCTLACEALRALDGGWLDNDAQP